MKEVRVTDKQVKARFTLEVNAIRHTETASRYLRAKARINFWRGIK